MNTQKYWDQTKPPDKYLTRVQLPVVDKNCWWRVICNDSLLNSSTNVWSISEWVCRWPLVFITPANGWLTVESSLTVSSVVLVPDGTERLLIPFSCQSYSSFYYSTSVLVYSQLYLNVLIVFKWTDVFYTSWINQRNEFTIGRLRHHLLHTFRKLQVYCFQLYLRNHEWSHEVKLVRNGRATFNH